MAKHESKVQSDDEKSSPDLTLAQRSAAALIDHQKAAAKQVEKRFTVTTPNPGFTGSRFGVRFIDGVGATDDETAAKSCGDCGYTVADAGKSKS